MQRLFLIVCLLASVFAVFAQTQHGYVKTRGRMNANGTVVSGTRLTGATITFKGRGSVTSGTDGVFTFAVPNKTFCIISVQKNGYQLYDNDLLGRNYNCSSNDLLVVMDTPDNVLADRLESEKKIRRTLRRQLQDKEDEIEVLKEQQKITEEQYRKQLQELYAAQENNEKLISEMAERYSTLDFDQMDDFQCRVAAYIQNGELARADSLLNTKGSMEERSSELDRDKAVIEANAEVLQKRLEEQAQSEALYAKKLEDFAADCYSRYEICKMKLDIDSAAYWLELRAMKDTLNIYWLLEVCRIEHSISSAKSRKYAEMAIRIANKYYSSDVDVRGKLLVSLGEIETDVNNKCDYFNKAINLYKLYYGENDAKLIDIYDMIGKDFLFDDREAIEYHKKAYHIRKKKFGNDKMEMMKSYRYLQYRYKQISYSFTWLADSAIYYTKKLLTLSKTYNSLKLASLYSDYARIISYKCELDTLSKGRSLFSISQCKKINKYYKKALDILCNNKSNNSSIENYLRVYTLMELAYEVGNVFCHSGMNVEGVNFFVNETSKERLCEIIPRHYYNLLCQLYLTADDVDAAVRSKISEYECSPRANKILWKEKYSIAQLYYKSHDYKNAIKWLDNAIIECPESDRKALSMLHRRKGIVYEKMNFLDESIDYLERSIEIQRNIEGYPPMYYNMELFNLASIYYKVGNIQSALSCYLQYAKNIMFFYDISIPIDNKINNNNLKSVFKEIFSIYKSYSDVLKPTDDLSKEIIRYYLSHSTELSQ